MNEVRDADIILHVIDVSHPFYEDHVGVVEETLKEFGSGRKNVIKVFNKVDVLKDKSKIDYIRNTYKNCVIISAQKGINISGLIEILNNAVECSYVEDEIFITIGDTKLVSQIHSLADVVSTDYEDEVVRFRIRASKENANKISKLLSSNKKIINNVNKNLRFN